MADGQSSVPAPSVAPELRNSLGFLLRLAQLHSFSDFFDTFQDQGVRPAEFSLLLTLESNPGVRQGVLAGALRIKTANMAKMVRAMETDGLIRRTTPPDDRRAMELHLTQAGAARLDQLRPLFQDHDQRNSAALSPEETAQLKALLRKYIAQAPKGHGA